MRVRRLARVDHLDGRVEPRQQLARGQLVGDHHVGFGEQSLAEHGDQSWIARPAAHQRDAARAPGSPTAPPDWQ
jgi:hypothetical protein